MTTQTKKTSHRPRLHQLFTKEAIQKHYEHIDLHEQISRKAFELYEQQGRQDGNDLEHWLQAEQLVKKSLVNK